MSRPDIASIRAASRLDIPALCDHVERLERLLRRCDNRLDGSHYDIRNDIRAALAPDPAAIATEARP